MLVLLKTAFYVAGWVMGVNGFGKRGSYCFGAKYIARSILSYHHFLRDRRRPRPPSLQVLGGYFFPSKFCIREGKKKNHAMNDEGCPGTEQWDDFVPSKVVSLAWAPTVRLPRQDAFQNEEVGNRGPYRIKRAVAHLQGG